MATPTWGLLTKSQTDSEKIESAIARLITEHNDDEGAHLEVGQALQSHKAAEIIDHLAGSIIADKIKDGQVNFSHFTESHKFIFTTFDSLDGWDKGGVGIETITCVLGGTKLATGAVNNDTAYIMAAPTIGFGDNPNFNAHPICQILIKIMDKANAEVHFHIGMAGFQAVGDDYIGFFFDQSKVYAVCRNVSTGETKSEITSPPELEDPHIYRIVYISSGSVDFYIDDVKVKTITTNIPTDDNANACIFLGVKNSHNAGEQTVGVFHAIYQETLA